MAIWQLATNDNGQKKGKNVYNRNRRHKTDNHVNVRKVKPSEFADDILLKGNKKLCYCVSGG